MSGIAVLLSYCRIPLLASGLSASARGFGWHVFWSVWDVKNHAATQQLTLIGIDIGHGG